ncbi:MAG: hypothetical protein ACJ8FS_15580 [Sphingomicrobium sp.]
MELFLHFDPGECGVKHASSGAAAGPQSCNVRQLSPAIRTGEEVIYAALRFSLIISHL